MLEIVEMYEGQAKSDSGFSDAQSGPARGTSLEFHVETAIEAVRTGIDLVEVEEPFNEADVAKTAEAKRLRSLDEEEIALKAYWEQNSVFGKALLCLAVVGYSAHCRQR